MPTLCPDENNGDVHCTVGTTAYDFLDPDNAGRIDYVFRNGFGPASAVEVFFNPKADLPEPIVPVLDHSAVLLTIPSIVYRLAEK